MGKLLLLLFFVSRLIFANPGNVFFDSKEYLSRWAEPNLLAALTTGHTPLHDGYVMTFWPIYQLGKILGINREYAVIFFQILMSTWLMLFFYKTVALLFSKKIAYRAALVLAISPLFWITNEAVMMESTYLFYWIASVYYLLLYLKKEGGYKALTISSMLWCLAFLTHTVVVLWIPVMTFLVWSINKKKLHIFLLFGLTSLLFVSFINSFLLSLAWNTSILRGFQELYITKLGEHAQLGLNIVTIARFIRNWLVPLFYNTNGMLIIFALVGFFVALRKRSTDTILFALWIVPTLITNQWWDSLFYGRHSLIAIFAICIVAVKEIKPVAFTLLILYMTICSVSSIKLLTNPIPYLQEAHEIVNLPPGGLLVESHFARPQINGEYFGEIFFVGEPAYDLSSLDNIINEYLENNKPVFITAQALSEPYGLYNGPYIHSLTLSYKEPFLLKYLADKYSFDQFVQINKSDNLTIYQIIASTGSYPEILKTIESNRRLDRIDFASKIVVNLFTIN